MQLTIKTADRGPKAYVALITGRDPKFKFARRFVPLADAGNRLNCYSDKVTVEDVPAGSVIQIRTTDYKGRASDQYHRVGEAGLTNISESDVYAALSAGGAR